MKSKLLWKPVWQTQSRSLSHEMVASRDLLALCSQVLNRRVLNPMILAWIAQQGLAELSVECSLEGED